MPTWIIIPEGSTFPALKLPKTIFFKKSHFPPKMIWSEKWFHVQYFSYRSSAIMYELMPDTLFFFMVKSSFWKTATIFTKIIQPWIFSSNPVPQIYVMIPWSLKSLAQSLFQNHPWQSYFFKKIFFPPKCSNLTKKSFMVNNPSIDPLLWYMSC